MSKLTITIDMGNAAFADNGGAEVAEILERLAYGLPFKVADGETGGKLLDSNGNTVGTWEVNDA